MRYASGSALFAGTLRMFERLGFREIGRTYPSRPVMRLDLGSSTAPEAPRKASDAWATPS